MPDPSPGPPQPPHVGLAITRFLDFTARAATLAAVVALFDFGTGYLSGAADIASRDASLQSLRAAAWIVLATYVVVGLVLFALGLVLAIDRTLAARAVALGLLASLLDINHVRWDVIRLDPGSAWDSLLRGIVVGLVAYLVGRRLAGGSPDTQRGASKLERAAGAVAALFLVGVSLAPALAGESDRKPAPQVGARDVPRVLLIVVDTLRADALSYRSENAPPTPNIDRLAQQSFSFRNARTPGAWTLPAVASIMTGASPLVHRAVQRNSRVPLVLPTLAEKFSEAGYRTAAVGHNYVLSPTRQLHRGFDHYGFDQRLSLPARTLGYLALSILRGIERGPDEDYEVEADDLNAAALNWIDAQNGDDYFLWLHYYDPHLAYDPPPDLRPKSAPPEGFQTRFPHSELVQIRAGYSVLDAPQRAWVKALYDAEVRSLDRELGRLFEELRQRGMYDDTLIVLTSDHGEEFWEHEGFEHGHTLYEEVLRVPLLIKLPGQTRGSIVETPVTLEHIYPSLLTVTGVSSDEEARDGFAPSLFDSQGNLASLDVATIASTGNLYYQDRIAILFDGWKYVRFLQTKEEELYDLAQDPEELHSLAPPGRGKLVDVGAASAPLAEGRRLCDEELERTSELRMQLGIGSGEGGEMSEAELQALRDLGYAGD